MIDETPEPARLAYSRDEMLANALRFMLDGYGPPKEMEAEQRDLWHQRYGMLVCFVMENWQ